MSASDARGPAAGKDAGARWWDAWSAHVAQGEDPSAFVREFPDEAVVALLATAGDEHPTARNVLLAEALRRVSGDAGDTAVLAGRMVKEDADEVRVRLKDTADAIHEAEAAVDAQTSPEHRGGPSAPREAVHSASREVESLRALVSDAERKVELLARIHKTGALVKPGRPAEADDDAG